MNKTLKVLGIVGLSLIVLIALTYIASAILARPIKQEAWYGFPSDHVPLIMAHQGGEGEYPSNSKLAFTKAVEAGVDVLDTDVHVTKDGQFVLFHDETLDSRTNGKGAVRDKTLAELQQVDFAYNWTPDGGKTYPYRGQGITVATARDLFESFPDERFGMEMKQISLKAAEDFCALIKQYKLEDKVLVSSFKQDNMDIFRKECPSVATSATEGETTVFYVFHRLGLVGLYRPKFSSLQVPEKSGNITILTKRFSEDAHKRGLKVYGWTIDTPEQAQHFFDLGVDGINTSYPKRVIDALPVAN